MAASGENQEPNSSSQQAALPDVYNAIAHIMYLVDLWPAVPAETPTLPENLALLQTLPNAHLESALVHLRCLLAFFSERTGREKDDVLAKHYGFCDPFNECADEQAAYEAFVQLGGVLLRDRVGAEQVGSLLLDAAMGKVPLWATSTREAFMWFVS